jgi:hypothetical protein
MFYLIVWYQNFCWTLSLIKRCFSLDSCPADECAPLFAFSLMTECRPVLSSIAIQYCPVFPSSIVCAATLFPLMSEWVPSSTSSTNKAHGWRSHLRWKHTCGNIYENTDRELHLCVLWILTTVFSKRQKKSQSARLRENSLLCCQSCLALSSSVRCHSDASAALRFVYLLTACADCVPHVRRSAYLMLGLRTSC